MLYFRYFLNNEHIFPLDAGQQFYLSFTDFDGNCCDSELYTLYVLPQGITYADLPCCPYTGSTVVLPLKRDHAIHQLTIYRHVFFDENGILVHHRLSYSDICNYLLFEPNVRLVTFGRSDQNFKRLLPEERGNRATSSISPNSEELQTTLPQTLPALMQHESANDSSKNDPLYSIAAGIWNDYQEAAELESHASIMKESETHASIDKQILLHDPLYMLADAIWNDYHESQAAPQIALKRRKK